MDDIRALLSPALGNIPCDTLLTNCILVNVLSGEIYSEDVSITNGFITGFGKTQAKEIIDLGGAYISPGFIDAHIHIESSLLSVPEFAKAVVSHGTSSVIADPHEFANVLGIEGIEYLLKIRESLPLDIFVMIPSCVPATFFETSGAVLSSDKLAVLKGRKNALGLGELMNYPGVIYSDEEVWKKITLFSECVIDGHAPMLSGNALSAYILSGAMSDHESTTKEEALEKLRKGMHIHLREGSTEKNLLDLLPVVNTFNSSNFSFVTDDRHPLSLKREGHIDNNIRKAIAFGIPPLVAIQMATINTARHYNLKRTGAIAPGFHADIVVFDNFESLNIKKVFKKGKLVSENGRTLFDYRENTPDNMLDTVHIGSINQSSFEINAKSRRIRIIEAVSHQIVTNCIIDDAKIVDGLVVSDTERDIIKLAVVERHFATGNIGLGFVKGFGIKNGALASSVGHDSHNIIVVGVDDKDMLFAVKRLSEIKGGMIAVSDQKVLAELPLPLAGLVSDSPLDDVLVMLGDMEKALVKMGSVIPEPFSVLSFLPLTPIPSLRLTDKGLFDSTSFSFTDLFES